MQARALERVGEEGLHFVTGGLTAEQLATLSVNGHAADPGRMTEAVQAILEEALSKGATVAVVPEGPYCAPV